MHRNCLSIALVIAATLWPIAVHANCDVFAVCVDNQIQVRLSVIHGSQPMYTGILIHRSTNGICGSTTVLNADAPLPWPQTPGIIHHLSLGLCLRNCARSADSPIAGRFVNAG
jgi:hypothetical protein